MEIVVTQGPWTPASATEVLVVIAAALAVHLAVGVIAWIATRRERRLLREAGIPLFQ